MILIALTAYIAIALVCLYEEQRQAEYRWMAHRMESELRPALKRAIASLRATMLAVEEFREAIRQVATAVRLKNDTKAP
ncbi:MAG: hypothetical protein AAF170_14185 [Bacteroidota bacterium]